MYCTRSALIELIEEVDQIHVDSHLIITELIQWLPTHTIESFMEDARSALELDGPEEEDELEYPVQGPDWPSEYDEPDPPTDIAEDTFFNEGVKAREAAKQKALCAPSIHLDLVQCSEV